MKLLTYTRQRLGWKLFISYLIVILIGVMTLMVAASLHTPSALTRHLAHMENMMGSDMGMVADLNQSFQTAVSEILLVAAGTAFIAAIVISYFVTNRIVTPIRAMKLASERIATGQYNERVQINSEDEIGILGRNFNQMAHTLSQNETRRKQLIGDVAHELRTPLTNIRSLMEGLIDEVIPANEEIFQQVHQETHRLERIVQDLSELSRAEEGLIPLSYETVSLTTLINTVIDRLQMQFDEKNVILQWYPPPHLPTISIDPVRMTQVLLNLLGNALQYTPPKGKVTIQATTKPNNIQITIQDTGQGISATDLPHIFERFYRVDKSRSRIGGGSGIGLTITKYWVEAHQGLLTATSAGLHQGSTFTITLPHLPTT